MAFVWKFIEPSVTDFQKSFIKMQSNTNLLDQKFIMKEKKNMSFLIKLVLTHRFFADFVVFDDIILEIKAAEGGLSDVFSSLLINYLKVSACKVGLLVNFGRKSLEHKRLVF